MVGLVVIAGEAILFIMMSSQESNVSGLPLSQETLNFMMTSVGDVSDSSFTNILPQDLSQKSGRDDNNVAGRDDDCHESTSHSTTSPSLKSDVCHDEMANVDVLQSIVHEQMKKLSDEASSLPITESYSGPYQFEVSLSTQSKNTKAVDWTYSESLRKVYVRCEVSCPFRFSSSSSTPADCMLRATPMFTKLQDQQEPVRQCPYHAGKAKPIGPPPGHLIHCEHRSASYQQHPLTAFHSVVVPYQSPQVGEWTTYVYQFTCFSSCAGGLNRRPVQVVFTLEDQHGVVLGREAMELRICACPGRDRSIEQKNSCLKQNNSMPERARTVSQRQPASPCIATKRPRPSGDVFMLAVCGEDNYQQLKKMRELLEVTSAMPRWQYEQLRSMQSGRRQHSPDVTHSQVSSSSPHVESAVEQAHSTHNAVDTSSNYHRNVPRLRGDDTIETWLEQVHLLSCLPAFHSCGLNVVSQLDDFTPDDFERLEFNTDAERGLVMLEFYRLRRHLRG